jgi:PTS system galactitol-specific IIC component
MISELAVQNGFIAAGTLVSNSALDAPVFCYAFSFIWKITKGNLLPLICVIYYIFGYILMIRDLRKTYAKQDSTNVVSD